MLIGFACDIKLDGIKNIPEGRNKMEKNLDEMNKGNLMETNGNLKGIQWKLNGQLFL